MNKYISDGRGRDTFITFGNDRTPPIRCFESLRPSKVATAKYPVLSRFQPDGSGRDMYCQVQKDPIVPIIGTISSNKSASPKRNNSAGVIRCSKPAPYSPTGSGRDLFFIGDSKCWHPPPLGNFRVKKTNTIVKARTSPPPRFISSGSGRDSFHNPHSYRFHRGQQPNVGNEGFAYGSESVSRNARYKFHANSRTVCFTSQKQYMERLSALNPTHKQRPITAKF